ncbi:thioredoxin family protein [Pseudofulvibacter geojedonensis]|uniref:Thioredoxin family protein n=1 Tax=Pseudofulvibacter geojedonensis TaxID=1123758 RepID=A0ABW3I4P0_9FLAO
MTYSEYKSLMNDLVAKKATTGENQTEALINYTFLNHKRMERLDKKASLTDEQKEQIKQFNKPVNWLVLTESWCGDAAQIMPYMNKIAELNKLINFKVLLRDENLELMDAHLTNGGRAIPKLVIQEKDSEKVIGTFGPRPQKATQMVTDFKAKNGELTSEFKKDLQIWYTKDKGKEIIKDLLLLLN